MKRRFVFRYLIYIIEEKSANKAGHKNAPLVLGHSLRSRPCQRRYTTKSKTTSDL